MAYISFQPLDNFKTHLYTGTGSSNAQTFPETTAMSPDFVWIKNRSAIDKHVLTNSAVGATKYLSSNVTTALTTDAESLKSFDSDGFTVGTMNEVNTNTELFVSWNWKMGTTSGIPGGSLSPIAYSFSTAAGQSVIQWLGVVSGAPQTIPHGLGVKPDWIIVKNYSGVDDWVVYNSTLGATKCMFLAGENPEQENPGPGTIWADTEPTTEVFTTGSNGRTGGGSTEYLVAYCFASTKGYSKFGSYIGDANADGPFIYTGFRPALVILKNADSTTPWDMYNDKTSTSGKNVANKFLNVNDAPAESTSSAGVKEIDLNANGFKIRGSNSEINASDETILYAAFAEFPLVSSNSIPGTAR